MDVDKEPKTISDGKALLEAIAFIVQSGKSLNYARLALSKEVVHI